jgi:hypothetical protein
VATVDISHDLVGAECAVCGGKVGIEWDTCIDTCVDEEGASLPDVGMVADGDGAV